MDMPGRRSFLIACGSAVALPVIGGVASAMASRSEPAFTSPAFATESPVEGGSADVAFCIDGWDSLADSQADPDTRPTIRITASWHATWR